MLYLCYGNRLEGLVDLLIQQHSASQQEPEGNPFPSLSILVPNCQVDTFARLAMVQRCASTVPVQSFDFPQFVAHLLANTPVRLLHAAVLQHLLFDLLRDDESLRHPLLEPVRSYWQEASESTAVGEHRCWQFAGEVAHLLEDYSLTRPRMLRAWEDHDVVDSDSSALGWQCHLWRQLRATHGFWRHDSERLGMTWLPWSAIGDWLGAHKSSLPSPLHVFGFSYLAESYRDLLARLSDSIDVHVYMLHPCLEDDWRLDYDDRQEPLALRLWGRAGRKHIRLLRAQTAGAVTTQYIDPALAGATVLRCLQRDIGSRHCTPSIPLPDNADGSLRFLECPDLRREVEIVADTIWMLMAQYQEPERMRFSDIAVLVPAAQQELYQAHIAAVFAACHAIPYSVTDVSPATASAVVDAILQLLALPLGSFSRRDVLRLLTHPVVCWRFPDVDTERWLQWCDALEIVSGIDHQDHIDTYIEHEVFHWEQGLRRLLLGTFLSGERSGVQQAFYLGEAAYLPYEVPADQFDNVAFFIRTVRSLMADVRYAQTAQLSLTQWSRFLGCLVSTYIGAPAAAEASVLTQCLQRLQALAELELPDQEGRPMSYQAAAAFARKALQDVPVHSDTYLTYGVAVSSWVPMRPLPFRVVFLLGLGESNFSTAEHDHPLDIRSSTRQVGEVSRRDQDLYMFLETLISARDCLVLSYVCRDAYRDEPLPASPLWYDFRTMLMQHYLSPAGLDTCTERHPIHRHDPRYFPELFPDGVASLTTMLPAARTAAQTVVLRQHLQRWCKEHHQAFPDLPTLMPLTAPQQRPALHAWLGLADVPPPSAPTLSPDQPVSISLETLHQFLLCPLQAWGRRVLHLREDGDDDLLGREDEPQATSLPATAALLRQVFLDVWQGSSATPTRQTWETAYTERARWLELAGKTPVGVLRQAERQRHLSLLRQWSNRVQATWGQVPADLAIRHFGQARAHAQVDTLDPALELDVAMPDAPSPIHIELYGHTQIVSPTIPGSLRLVLRRHLDSKDVLRGFLDYVVLTASQRLAAASYRSLVIAQDNTQQAAFANLTVEMARDYLATLIADFLGQTHTYLMPVEAVLKYDPAASTKTFAEVVKDCLATQQYSSRYGPVPFPEDYPAPSETLVQAMIARRFGLFRRLYQR